MRRILNWLSRQRFPYEPLIHISISKGRILHNLAQFRTLAPGGMVTPVLKSNAYGHGLIEIATILKDEPNIPFFVVDSYFEAVALRAKGIHNPLLVIGYTRPETIRQSSLKNVAFTITTIETLRALRDTSRSMHVHLKIDTGMHRQGIDISEISEAMTILHANKNIVLEGVCTHLSDADNADSTYTEAQLGAWSNIAGSFKAAFPSLRYIHGCNSDGSRFSGGTHDNLIRVGIGLYMRDQPALSMNTIITSLRTIHAGETVGYSRTFVATKDMKVATVPVGYFEGIDRRLSSGPNNEPRAYFQVGPNKVACPIIGRVSMNITSIDVSAVSDASVGMHVQIISNTSQNLNSIKAFAKACGTIEYEIATGIPAHLKRDIVD